MENHPGPGVTSTLTAVLAAALVAACAGPEAAPQETATSADAAPAPADAAHSAVAAAPESESAETIEVSPEVDAAPAAPRLPRRGVNLGNALDAPAEGDWGVVLDASFFAAVADAGFDTVRLPVRFSGHALEEPPYTIDEDLFARVDWAVDQALGQDLAIIVDLHHYDALMAAPGEHGPRLKALWSQIAARLADASPDVLFELLNEPHPELYAEDWNALLAEVLAAVRETNPDRTVVVGPDWWNHYGALGDLVLPEDDHLLATFHFYEPFDFTHQGAEWVDGADAWLGTTWTGTPEQEAAVRGAMDEAAAWAHARGVPLFLGEFGAYGKADYESRVAWTGFVAREAEARGISWAYWELAAVFGIWDADTGLWDQPMLEALIPPD